MLIRTPLLYNGCDSSISLQSLYIFHVLCPCHGRQQFANRMIIKTKQSLYSRGTCFDHGLHGLELQLSI